MDLVTSQCSENMEKRNEETTWSEEEAYHTLRRVAKASNKALPADVASASTGLCHVLYGTPELLPLAKNEFNGWKTSKTML